MLTSYTNNSKALVMELFNEALNVNLSELTILRHKTHYRQHPRLIGPGMSLIGSVSITYRDEKTNHEIYGLFEILGRIDGETGEETESAIISPVAGCRFVHGTTGEWCNMCLFPHSLELHHLGAWMEEDALDYWVHR